MADVQDTQALGTFEQHGEDLDLRFERLYPRPVETVWSALTEPERLKDWMGASLVEPRAGGRIDLMIGGVQPMTGRILIWDPPRTLEFSWSNADTPNSVVRYELIREGASTRMIFTHKGVPYARSGLMLPGWHTFFALLGSLLDGALTPHAPRSWREMQRVYVDHYQLRGVLLDVPKSHG
jgi:uncharacterized protein YndB with AHSA1/START domain